MEKISKKKAEERIKLAMEDVEKIISKEYDPFFYTFQLEVDIDSYPFAVIDILRLGDENLIHRDLVKKIFNGKFDKNTPILSEFAQKFQSSLAEIIKAKTKIRTIVYFSSVERLVQYYQKYVINESGKVKTFIKRGGRKLNPYDF